MKAEKQEKEVWLEELRRAVLESEERLPERKLLELTLSYGVQPREAEALTVRLYRRFGSLRGVMRASAEALVEVEGMTEGVVLLLQLLASLSRSRIQQKAQGALDDIGKWASFLWPYFYRQRQERFYLLGLGRRGQIKCCELLGQGGDTFVDLDIKRMCAVAMRNQVAGVVLAHNHPGGIATPSQNDIKFTRACREALEQLEISLLDHLVFTDEECMSFADSRMID